MNITRLSLIELVEKTNNGELSSYNVANSYIIRSKEVNQFIEVWETENFDSVIQNAKVLDGLKRDNFVDAHSLHGIPIGIKDIIDTKGIRTSYGSDEFYDHIPSKNADVVNRIYKNNGCVLGKTVTTEFAWRRPGKTKNPWNYNHTPGGSSSGSAAAVASCLIPASIGSQTIGSVIRPAAYCGIVGYKPSFGLISTSGIHPLSPTLDHVGLFCRSVKDVAYFAACLASNPSKKMTKLEKINKISNINSTIKNRKINLIAIKGQTWNKASDVQKENFILTIENISKKGFNVEFVELPKNFESVIEVINGIVAYEANELYGQYHDPIASSRIGKEIIQLIKYGETIKTSKYNSYKLIRNNYFNFLQEIMFGCDAIISPSSTGEAPFSLNDTGDACFSALWTLVGLPEITIPSGFGDNRLPLGIQLIGKYKNDYELLIIADLLSSILGNIGFPPEPEMLLIES